MRDHADVLKDRTVLDAHFLQPRVGQLKRDIYRHVFFFVSSSRRNGKTKTTLLFFLLMGKQKRYDLKKLQHHLFFDYRQEGERLCLLVSPLRMGTPIHNEETKKKTGR